MKKIYFGLFSLFCIAIFAMALIKSAAIVSQLTDFLICIAFNLAINIGLENTLSLDVQVNFDKQQPIRFRDLSANRTYSILPDGITINGFNNTTSTNKNK